MNIQIDNFEYKKELFQLEVDCEVQMTITRSKSNDYDIPDFEDLEVHSVEINGVEVYDQEGDPSNVLIPIKLIQQYIFDHYESLNLEL